MYVYVYIHVCVKALATSWLLSSCPIRLQNNAHKSDSYWVITTIFPPQANGGLLTPPVGFVDTEPIRKLEDDNQKLISRVTELQCKIFLVDEKVGASLRTVVM